MIDPIFQTQNYQMARKLLDVTALRQQAIAANIANAETPGYRRVDVSRSFLTELRAQAASPSAQRDFSRVQTTLQEDPHSRTTRPDGNNIEVENELLEMNRNTVAHEFVADLASRHIKQLKMAITGRPSA